LFFFLSFLPPSSTVFFGFSVWYFILVQTQDSFVC
jgi:hypothetical protein